MDIAIESSWKDVLQREFDEPYFKQLVQFLKKEKEAGQRMYPRGSDIFKAFDLTPFDEVKVVILGQDPYHGPGQAMGLSFSVPPGVPQPPSLKNIFKELHGDMGIAIPTHGDLTPWAKQGVFLLNTILTVRSRHAASHREKGWEIFTDNVIKTISDQRDGIVFLLRGSYAKSKGTLIDERKHTILTAPHPSPLSAYRGWFGCQHFSKTNDALQQYGKSPIDRALV